MAGGPSNTDEVGLGAIVQAITVEILRFQVEVAHDQPGGGLQFDPGGKGLHQGNLLHAATLRPASASCPASAGVAPMCRLTCMLAPPLVARLWPPVRLHGVA
eukprot:6467413-Amphidinium_carterae.2